jgi:competence protein ComEC
MENEPLYTRLANLPFFWILLAFLAGIPLAERISLPAWLWLALAGLSLLAGLALFFLRRQAAGRVYFFIPLALFLGAAHLQNAQARQTPETLAYYNDTERRVWVTGTLIEPPDRRDRYANLRVKVSRLDLADGQGDQPVEGLVLVRVSSAEGLEYGDPLRIRGYLKTPSETEEFSYRDYLAMQGIHSYMRVSRATKLPHGGEYNFFLEYTYAVKASLLKRIYQLFPDPEASLLAGILLGVESGLAPDLQQAFKNTGTSHIIAISGFNIAIIAGLFVAIFSRLFGSRLGAVTAILGIAAYTILVGADASVVRAAIMGSFSILAGQAGRRNYALNTLALVAALMSLWNPLVLHDVGFQLSFAATLGLVLYAQPLQDSVALGLKRFLPADVVEKIIGPLSDYFLMTLAAQFTTLPVIVYHFGRISIVSLFVNPLILPAQPPVMILGGLALLAGKLYFPLGQAIAFIAWPFPAYTIRMVELFDKIPGGVFVLGDFSPLAVTAIYLLMFGLTLASAPFRRRFLAVATPSTLVLALGISAFYAIRGTANAPDGRLHLTFLDTGSGDAILIQSPTGRHVLINGGPSISRLSDQLGRRLPPFNRALDYLVVGSTQSNQVDALPEVVQRFTPGAVLWSGNVQASASASRLDGWFASRPKIPFTRAAPGYSLDLAVGAKLRVLTISDRGAILALEWDTFRAILPVGADFDSFESLNYGQSIGPVSVLLLADSGYAPSNPPEWLDALQPQILVLSVEAGDLNGMPSQETLNLVDGLNLLRTDRNGWIHISTDGKRMWVQVERK